MDPEFNKVLIDKLNILMENYKLCQEKVIECSNLYLTCLASYKYVTIVLKNNQEYIAENTQLNEAVQKYIQCFNVLVNEYNSRPTTLTGSQGSEIYSMFDSDETNSDEYQKQLEIKNKRQESATDLSQPSTEKTCSTVDSDESNNDGSKEGIEMKKKGKESATDLSQLLLTEKISATSVEREGNEEMDCEREIQREAEMDCEGEIQREEIASSEEIFERSYLNNSLGLCQEISASSVELEGNTEINCAREIQGGEMASTEEIYEILCLNNNQVESQKISVSSVENCVGEIQSVETASSEETLSLSNSQGHSEVISASSMEWEGNAAMNCLREIQRRETSYFQESFETLSLNNNQGHFQMQGNAEMNCVRDIQRGEVASSEEIFETLSLNNNLGDCQEVSDRDFIENLFHMDSTDLHGNDAYFEPPIISKTTSIAGEKQAENQLAKEPNIEVPISHHFIFCQMCGDLVNNKFEHHMFVYHSPKKCSVCNTFVADNIYVLENHVKNYHELHKVCFECSEVHESAHITRHQQFHLQSVEQVNSSNYIDCPKRCGKKASQIIGDKLVKKGYYACKCCSLAFNTKFHLNFHYVMCHCEKEKRENSCKLCYLTFEDTSRLKKHLSRFHFVRENTYPEKIMCMICFCKFDEKNAFILHLKNDHRKHPLMKKALEGETNGVRSVKCLYCDLVFKGPKVQAIHTTVCHEKPAYICPVCSEQFFSKGLMDIHFSEHTQLQQRKSKKREKKCN